jgi:hypothetical protein
MRVPRLRFTVRGMLIAVGFLTILCGMTVGLWRRHVSFKRLADEYAEKSYSEMAKGFRVQLARWLTDGEVRMGEEHFRLKHYYDEMQAKYERAAARPWLSVEPDRPPPEWPEGVPRSEPQSNVEPPNARKIGRIARVAAPRDR